MDVPNPGSNEAIKMGCTCAVIDNYFGAGFQYGGVDPSFWISADCPLHVKKEEE